MDPGGPSLDATGRSRAEGFITGDAAMISDERFARAFGLATAGDRPRVAVTAPAAGGGSVGVRLPAAPAYLTVDAVRAVLAASGGTGTASGRLGPLAVRGGSALTSVQAVALLDCLVGEDDPPSEPPAPARRPRSRVAAAEPSANGTTGH